MPTKAKRKRSARQGRDAELIATLELLAAMLGKLNETAARLETTIARSTERFAAMRRS